MGSPGFGEGTGTYKAREFGTEGVVFERSTNIPPQDFDRWPEIGYAPMSGGGNSEAPMGQEEVKNRFSRQRAFDYLKKVHEDPSSSTYFELTLNQAELLPGLEESGILPVPGNPNPFDPEFEEEQHEQWWQAHPEEGEEFGRMIDKRREIFRYLYIGAAIGRLFVDLFAKTTR